MRKTDETLKIKCSIINVFVTLKLPFNIQVANMAKEYPRQCEYEPELQTGLIYRHPQPKAMLRIFVSGSVSILGGKVFLIKFIFTFHFK